LFRIFQSHEITATGTARLIFPALTFVHTDCTYVCVYVVCMYVCMYVCMCEYMYVYINPLCRAVLQTLTVAQAVTFLERYGT
jgi:hypothetical protein